MANKPYAQTDAPFSSITRIQDIARRFTIDQAGCWNWGRLGVGHYGTYQGFPAHRFMFELINGYIEHGLVIDHTCHNRACANPHHLEAVDVSTNASRRIDRMPISPTSYHRIREMSHNTNIPEQEVIDFCINEVYETFLENTAEKGVS